MGTAITLIIIVVALGAGIYGRIQSSKKQKELAARGDIRTDRAKDWVHQTTVFSTTVDSIDKIYQAMHIDWLKGQGIECGRSNGACQFRLAVTSSKVIESARGVREVDWETSLTPAPPQGQKHQYKFSFQHMRNVNGVPQGTVGLNILLTEIEKAVLSLDPQADVQRLSSEYSTQRNTRRVVG